MVVGFNHNFRYKGEVYHIQTEDSGIKNPNIVTLLYQGGTILASKKTSYADITRVDNLDQVVEELMKEQHKAMLRNLKTGEFDAVIQRFQSARNQKSQIPKLGKISAPLTEATPAAVKSVVPETPSASPADAPVAPVASVAAPKPELQAVPRTPPPAAVKPPSSTIEFSLDEVILSYLMGDDK